MITLITSLMSFIAVIIMIIAFNKTTKKYEKLKKELDQLEDTWLISNNSCTIIRNNVWLLSVAIEIAVKECGITKNTIYITNMTNTKCYNVYYNTTDKSIKVTNGPITLLTEQIN